MKRLFSVFMAVCLVMSALSVTAFAANATNSSGKCHLYFDGAYSGGSQLSSIRINKSVELRFTVIDTGTDRENLVPDTFEIIYDSEGLPLQNGKTVADITLTPQETKAGKLQFDVRIPVTYNAKDNEVSFTIFYQSKGIEEEEEERTTPSGGAAAASEGGGENQTPGAGTGNENNSTTPPSGENVVIYDHSIDCTYTVNECREYVEEDDDDEDEEEIILAPMTPYIIVSNYSYGADSVTAGEDFTLTLTLKNTSKEYDLDNIVMNITPQGVFSVASSSNTLYLEKIAKGGSVTKSIDIKAGMTKLTDDDDSNTINLSFKFQYEANDKRFDGSSSESITIPVDYPDRFELGTLEYWDQTYVGEEVYVYLPMVNKGRSSVYNLTATLQGDMSNAGQSQYVGNLSAGTENGADFSMRFDEPGEKECEIVVTYEDANMIERTASKTFKINVMSWEEPVFDEPVFEEDPSLMEEPTVPTFTNDPEVLKLVGIISAVTIVGVAVFMLRQKRSAESVVDDEEL